MKRRAYLDIETTGLSRDYYDLTVIGIAIETNASIRLIQLIENRLTDVRLFETLQNIDELYTYNGSRFDLPFIKARLQADLRNAFKHTDLMYHCWKNNLKGGLKNVERLLNIPRKLKEVDGFMAVKLWWDYANNKNHASLKTLLDYNAEDVLNLITLRKLLAVD
jgi:uncharacterized protein